MLRRFAPRKDVIPGSHREAPSIWQHKNDQVGGFTRFYGVHRLVYFEVADSMYAAISREKQIKAGSRAKKLKLIEAVNPEWNDLYASIV